MKPEVKILKSKEMAKKNIASILRKKKQMSLDTAFKKAVKRRNPELYWEVVKEITENEVEKK